DKVVEIEPQKPAPCSASNSCPSGQLCQRGVCSATCLPSGVPAIGAAWNTSVVVVDDQAFFTQNQVGSLTTYTGTGQVGQALYNGTDLRLTLYQQMAHGRASGTVEVLLPPGSPVVPFALDETISISLQSIDSSSRSTAAVTVRDASGALLLAAD